ncbi:hypothetical protein D3C87_1672910 [compost metagenome]
MRLGDIVQVMSSQGGRYTWCILSVHPEDAHTEQHIAPVMYMSQPKEQRMLGTAGTTAFFQYTFQPGFIRVSTIWQMPYIM